MNRTEALANEENWTVIEKPEPIGDDVNRMENRNEASQRYDAHKPDLHAPGAKDDSGKIMAGLVLEGFSKALLEVSKIGTFGATKYSPNGWKHVPNAKARYTDAMLRHFLKESAEGYLDEEMELPHAAAVAWNALARLHFILEEQDATAQRELLD